MKRTISLLLVPALLGAAISFGPAASATTTTRPTVTLVQSGFENGLETPYFANESDEGASATVTPISIADSANAYMHITDRVANQRSATTQQDIKTQLVANGADGKYYISARIKLDDAGATAYAVPYIQGSTIQLQPGGGERFAVSSSWGEIGKTNTDAYMAFSAVATGKELTAANLASMSYGKFYIMLFTGSTGTTTYDGSYSIDDVCIWFVPNSGAPASVTTKGTSILNDSNFEANISNPTAYNNLFGGNTWYVATNGGSGAAADRLCTLTVATESVSTADTTVVHTGTGALHITNRPGPHQSVAVDLKDTIDAVGALSTGEGYYISVWVRAETGHTIQVMPIFGAGAKGSAFIMGGDYVTVTDQWTEVGIKVDHTYSMFAKDDGTFFDPYGAAWANIRLRTDSTDSFYVDDFKALGPQTPADAATTFIQGVASLPAPSSITRANEATITALEAAYAALNLTALPAEQQTQVAAAKATLDAARAAFDALPVPKTSFQPTFAYSDKANLIATYGDLETFTSHDYVWNEVIVECVHPVYTLITDPSIAHGGNNCLLISDREKTQHAAAFTLTQVVKDNGGGKYYFSCWMRTKNPGEVMDVFPLLYVGGLGMEFYIDGDARYTITDKWTYVGVTYSNVGGYYKSNGAEMPDINNTAATYVALRFYGQNETLASADDGEIYPDYYIDDLRVWKYFDGQETYVDANGPTNTASSSTPTVSDGKTADNGTTSPPRTGDEMPLALPVFGAAALGALVVTGKLRRRKV